MKNEKIKIVLLSLVIALSSCQKGDTGNPGPAGSNGANGNNGTNGTNGTNGLNGYANVISLKFAVGPGGWNNSVSYVTNNVAVPQITQAILDSGLIMPYWIYNSAGMTIPLPFTASNIKQSYWPEIELGNFRFVVDNFGVPMSNPTTPYNIRLVLATAHARLANPNLNWNDYQAVKARFNLND